MDGIDGDGEHPPDIIENKNTIVAQTRHNGKGAFAARAFRKGERVIEFQGPLTRAEDMPNPYTEDRWLQIGKKLYMGPLYGTDYYFNHSCNPNTGVAVEGSRVFLIAIRDIRIGEETAWDYSSTMDEDKWELDCKCGSDVCRGRIRDFKHLPRETKIKYARLDVVPDYNLVYVSESA